MSTCGDCRRFEPGGNTPDGILRAGHCGTQLPRYHEVTGAPIHAELVLPTSRACSAFSEVEREVKTPGQLSEDVCAGEPAPADGSPAPHLQLLLIRGALKSLSEQEREAVQIAAARLRVAVRDHGALGQIALALVGAELAAQVQP